MDSYIGTITQKGQVTIPLEFRKKLGLKPYSKVNVTFDNKAVKLTAEPDILDLAGFIRAPKGKNALKAREYMENNYKRT